MKKLNVTTLVAHPIELTDEEYDFVVNQLTKDITSCEEFNKAWDIIFRQMNYAPSYESEVDGIYSEDWTEIFYES